VASFELSICVLDLIQRIDAGDRHLELTFLDEPGELGENLGVGRRGTTLGLDSVPLCGLEVDDRVYPFGLHAQRQRKLDVVFAERVDERVGGSFTGLPDPLADSLAVADRYDAVLSEPLVVSLAGQADDLRSRMPGELYGERADTACGRRDNDGLPRGEGHRTNGRVGQWCPR